MKTIDSKTLLLTENRQMHPFDLKRCLPEGVDFQSFLFDEAKSAALPQGLNLSEDGVLSGAPEFGENVGSPHELYFEFNDEEYELTLILQIGVQMQPDEMRKRQNNIWEAIKNNEDLSDIATLVDRPITKRDIYHLLERFASFTVWNADDRRLAAGGKGIKLQNAGNKYQVFDFEVCLVCTPKDLYADDRCLGDALTAATAIATEAHKRRWNVEFSGFDKMAVAAYYHIQDLNKKSRHKAEVRNYLPPGAGQEQEASPEPE